MAKFTVKFQKKGMMAGPVKAHKAGQALAGFVLVEGNGDIVTVNGDDGHGNVLDISSTFTITADSDNTSVLTVDPPAGVTYHERGVIPGTANVTVVATANDGSTGPFSFIDPVEVQKAPPGPITGLVLIHGTPIPN